MRWRLAQTPYKFVFIRLPRWSAAMAGNPRFIIPFLGYFCKTNMMDRALFIVVPVLLVASATLPAFAGSKKKKATPAQYEAPVIASV
jgi:hypothetical protein